MKSVLVVLLTFIVTLSMAQIKEGEDGKYYNEKGDMYSGEHIEYYENDSIHFKMILKEGVIEGDVSYFFENGSKKEIRSYLSGKMHGLWVEWNIEGVKIAEANYKNNKKDGKWYVWDDTGVLRYDMEYKEGKKVGIWIIYNEKGEEIQKKDFNSKN
jgi:antitoxin component YwqK of YwqJK toxin-antitoxin module